MLTCLEALKHSGGSSRRVAHREQAFRLSGIAGWRDRTLLPKCLFAPDDTDVTAGIIKRA